MIGIYPPIAILIASHCSAGAEDQVGHQGVVVIAEAPGRVDGELLSSASGSLVAPRLAYDDAIFAADIAVADGSPQSGRVPPPPPPPSPADTSSGVEVYGTIGGVSDYRFRGVSLSDGHVVPQAGLSAAYGSFVANVWTSRIAETAGGSRQEVDVSLAATTDVAGFALTGTGLMYLYPGDRYARYGELQINVSRGFGPIAASLGLSWAPRQAALGDDDNLYVNAAARWDNPVANLSGTIGRERGAFAADGKWDWNLTASRGVGPVSLSLSYVDSDARVPSTRGRNLAGSMTVLGISLNY